MNLISKFGIKRVFFYGFALVLILGLSLPMIINPLANTAFVKNKISTLIFEKTQVHIDPASVAISILPQPEIQVDHFSFKPRDSILAGAKQIHIFLDLVSLVKGQAAPGRVIIDSPTLEFLNSQTSQTGVPPLSMKEIGKLGDTIFSHLPEKQKYFELVFKNIITPYFKRLDGSLSLSKNNQNFVLNTTIEKINLKPSNLTLFKIEDDLAVQSVEVEKLNAFLRFNTKGTLHGSCDLNHVQIFGPGKAPVFKSNQIQSSFKLSDQLHYVSVPAFDIQMPQANIGIELKSNIEKKQSSILFSGTGVNVGQARKATLSLVKNNEIVNTLFDILLDGTAADIQVGFTGSTLSDLFDENKLELSGHVDNGKVHIPETPLIISQISGHARIKKGVLDIKAQAGQVQNAKIKNGVLSVDLLNYVDYPFKGNFDLDVDLSTIPETLISLLPDTILAQELARVDKVSGKARTALGLELKTNEDFLNVSVKTQDFSAKGFYDRIPGEIQLHHIGFTYESDIITLSDLAGQALGSNLADINARVDLNDEIQLMIESGSGDLELSTLLPWVISHDTPARIISPVKTAKGRVTFSDLSLSGPILKPEKWIYHAAGNCNQIDVSTLPKQEQVKALTGQYMISDRGIKLENIAFTLDYIPVIIPHLDKKSADSFFAPVQVINGHFSNRLGQSSGRGDLLFKTGPLVGIQLSGSSPYQLMLKKISLKDEPLSNVTITPEIKKEKILFNFKGRLDTRSFDKMLKPGSFLAEKIHSFTQNQPVNAYSDKNNTLVLESKDLDLTPFLEKSGTKQSSQKIMPNHDIKLKIDRMGIKSYTLTDTQAGLSFKNDQSYIRLDQTFLCGIKTSGFINLKKDVVFANLPFESPPKSEVKDLLGCLMKKEKLMDGQYTLNGSLMSSGKAKTLSDNIEGQFVFNAVNGRIYKLTLLSRILSVINVSNIFKGKIPNLLQQGFEYKDLIVDAEIKESRIHLKKAVIDGTDMTLIFRGWLDPLNDTLDLTCLVAPFKTIDLIIKYIPIVNTMLDGRLMSVPVKATGKLSDPDVIPLHPSAVGKGLINMMSDILKTPVKLWDKLSRE